MTESTKSAIAKRKRVRKELSQRKSGGFFFDLPKGLLVLIVVMVFAQVLVSNIFGVKGAELVTLEEERNSLKHEKTVLENKVSELSSLSRIEKECEQELSMKKVDRDIIFIEDESFASLR